MEREYVPIDEVTKQLTNAHPKTARYCEGVRDDASVISKRVFYDDEQLWLSPFEESKDVKDAIQLGGYEEVEVQPVPTGEKGSVWWNTWYV